MKYLYSDGGRRHAGLDRFAADSAGDCVTRALAIASGETYSAIYDRLSVLNVGRHRGSKAPDFGVNTATAAFKVYMTELGFDWMARIHPEHGPVAFMTADDLPKGKIVCDLGGHYAAVIDGVLHDTHDCSKEGKATVRGYWLFRTQANSVLDKVRAKLRKLRDMKNDGSSLAEAAIAAERMHAIMADHNLSEADLDDPANREHRIHDIFEIPYREFAHTDLWNTVARSNYCSMSYRSPDKYGGRTYRFTIVGKRTNVHEVGWLADHLSTTMQRLSDVAVKTNGTRKHGKTVRAEYMSGFIMEIGRRLRERMRAEEADKTAMPTAAAPERTRGTALVLVRVNEAEENTGYTKQVIGKLRSASYRPSVDGSSDAFRAGREAGRRVSLDRQVSKATRKAIT